MAGIFQSMLYGMNQARAEQRQREEDEFTRQERAYQQQRRGVIDEREDTSWQDGREDRRHLLEVERPMQTEGNQLTLERGRFQNSRLPVEAQQSDQRFAQDYEAGSLSNSAARFQLGRMPTEAAQSDARFALDAKAAQQGIVSNSLQIDSARRAAAIEEAQQPAKLDEVRLDRERRLALDELSKVGQQFMLTGMKGNKPEAAQMINQLWAKVTDDPDGDAGVRVNEEGIYYLEGPDGKPLQPLGDEDSVMEFAFTFLSDPQSFIQTRQATMAARAQAQAAQAEARATDPRRFVETAQRPDGTMALIDRATGRATNVTDQSGQPFRGAVQGEGGKVPARLQEVEAVASRLQQRAGESPDDRWMRAYEMVSSRAGESPEQAASSFYETVIRGLVRPDPLTGRVDAKTLAEAEATAQAMTQRFMDRFGSAPAGGQPADEFDPDDFLNQF